ncbi:TPA: hypothetical protein ACGCBC_006099, partial [Pseudomonas aeruginosa]
MAWIPRWWRASRVLPKPDVHDQPDGWQRHVHALGEAGLPEPGAAVRGDKPATLADEQRLYDVTPSFVGMLPWVEYLPRSKSLLLEDGQ